MLWLAASLALVLSAAQPVDAAVTLLYFRAIGTGQGVFLEWETATELDNSGFYVLRSDTEAGTYTRISEFIPSEAIDPLVGVYYSYNDIAVTMGHVYWYQLEALDNGNQSSFYGPISATAGGTPTPTTTNPSVLSTPTATATATRTATQDPGAATATQTSTATSTQTGTLTPATPTLTATRTPANTATSGAYPGPATATGQARTVTPGSAAEATVTKQAAGTATVVATTTITATATLIPLPELTLQFPTPLLTASPSPTPAAAAQSDQRAGMQMIFLAFILSVWGLLGGWFYFTLRKMNP